MQGGKIFPVDKDAPNGETMDKAAAVIARGGLVVFPTSSFYGIGARAFDPEAVARVFRVKKRDPQKPLLILIASLADLGPLVRSVPSAAAALVEAFWPGSLTLVFEAAGRLPSNLTGRTGKIGIRLASHPVALRLVQAVGSPITGTSANLSGKGGCREAALLDPQIRYQVDMVLDAGRLPGKKGSSVVDVTVRPPAVLREGAVSAEEIARVL